MDAPEPVLGIDLGTTNSACAVVREGRASVIRRGEERIVPSVVAALSGGALVVGEEAKRHRAVDPSAVVFSAKRLIGRRFSAPEVQRMREQVPYGICEGNNDAVMVELGGRRRSLVEISATVLGYLREMAEANLGQRVRRAVIAVPANFTDAQRSATRMAARMAGLDVIRVINEPTAAALAYGYVEDTDRRIAVYDFGGGTFDVTILQISGNVFEVLATSGEMFLGGDDIDTAIMQQLVERLVALGERDPRSDPAAMGRLRAAAEALKIELSSSSVATVEVAAGAGSPARALQFTEAELRPLIEAIVQRTVPVCEDALRWAGLQPGGIDDVVLVGGTTQLPVVREVVGRVFGRPPQTSINPMSVVAVGAAIQGAALLGSLVPLSDGSIGAPAPAVLLDVVPRSLGVRTAGGFVDFIIERNQALPVEQTRLFTTTHGGQRVVRIQVCEGEAEAFSDNHRLGEVVLTGLRDAPRGEVTIAVTFEINTDGLVEVRALDQQTGQQQMSTMRVLGDADAGPFDPLPDAALDADEHEGAIVCA